MPLSCWGLSLFLNMSTDLFPSMNLPYVVVMTTYQGASPEEVEQTVTKPIEQALASTGNLKDMTFRILGKFLHGNSGVCREHKHGFHDY